MKLYDILMTLSRDTMIRITIRMYGMNFAVDRTAESFLDNDAAEELLERRVTDMRVVERGILKIVLAE